MTVLMAQTLAIMVSSRWRKELTKWDCFADMVMSPSVQLVSLKRLVTTLFHDCQWEHSAQVSLFWGDGKRLFVTLGGLSQVN